MDIDAENELTRLITISQRQLWEARWNNIYRWWQEGKPLEEMAEHYDLHVSTITRLLKTAARKRIEKGLMVWPTDNIGRKICDIAHPMPKNEDPRTWCHARFKPLMYAKRVARDKLGYCPVCRKGGHIGKPVKPKTLVEVFADE